jgi:DNA-directed RNA polymerase subunit RPC12/RpoP
MSEYTCVICDKQLDCDSNNLFCKKCSLVVKTEYVFCASCGTLMTRLIGSKTQNLCNECDE